MANAVYVPRFGSQVRSGPTDDPNLHPLGPLKRAVLRTVSKMLRENGCTRQRLRALSGGSQSGRGRLNGATPPTRHAV
ncbi:unnamed protein product [Merluccius merluccius]